MNSDLLTFWELFIRYFGGTKRNHGKPRPV